MSLLDIDSDSLDRGSPLPSDNAQLPHDVRKALNSQQSSYTRQLPMESPQRMVMKNNMILYYDDQNRVIGVQGFIPSVAQFPVTIYAQYGYDVFVDILNLPRP